MNRYQIINQQYEVCRGQLVELNKEYEEKLKGNVYLKRKMQLENKGRDLIRKAEAIGTVGNVCHIHGKRSRRSMKNPKIMIQENFNLYFVNVSEEEASALVALHVKNVIYHTIRFIRPGIIITSS